MTLGKRRCSLARSRALFVIVLGAVCSLVGRTRPRGSQRHAKCMAHNLARYAARSAALCSMCIGRRRRFALAGLSADTTAVWGIGTSLSLTKHIHIAY